MLITHKRYMPAIGIPGQKSQWPLCITTVLSINEKVKDCAAYEAITPQTPDDEVIRQVKDFGNKIRPDLARKLFPEIDELGLVYRK